MEIRNHMTDAMVLATIGQRLKRHRLERNVTQTHLAEEAGVSTPTLQRLEAGSTVQAVSLLRVLRALDLLDNLDTLIPELQISPLAMLERRGARRRRASKAGDDRVSEPWTWEETP